VGTRWRLTNKSHLRAGTHGWRTKETREQQQEGQAQGLVAVSPGLTSCEQREQLASFHNWAHHRHHLNRAGSCFSMRLFIGIRFFRGVAQSPHKGTGGAVVIPYDN
jgi:hypothetical protein